MIRRHWVSRLAAGALLLSLAACEGGGDDGVSNTGGTGHLAIELTDKPIDIDTVQSVNVTIDSVIVFPQGSEESEADKIELMPHSETFDLLTLTGGVTDLLAEGDLEAGFYTKIRLRVSDADMVFKDGTEVDLKLESGKVDINVPFEIAVSELLVVTLDFEADASLHVVGAGNSGQYILRPVVKALRVSDPDPIDLPGPEDPNAPGDPNAPSDPNAPGDPNAPSDPNAPADPNN